MEKFPWNLLKWELNISLLSLDVFFRQSVKIKFQCYRLFLLSACIQRIHNWCCVCVLFPGINTIQHSIKKQFNSSKITCGNNASNNKKISVDEETILTTMPLECRPYFAHRFCVFTTKAKYHIYYESLKKVLLPFCIAMAKQ